MLRAVNGNIIENRAVVVNVQLVLRAGNADIDFAPFLVSAVVRLIQHEIHVVELPALCLMYRGDSHRVLLLRRERFVRRLENERFEIRTVQRAIADLLELREHIQHRFKAGAVSVYSAA